MRIIIGITCTILLFINCSTAQIDHSAAEQYFSEVEQILERDGGHLWGESLQGPILLVDPDSRQVVANYADREGNLTRRGNIYTGKLPEEFPIANTAVEWSGVKWAMIMTPVSSERYARSVLFVHELWHRIQEDIGFPPTNPSNNHLDTKEGRIWLQLEMRALQQALNHTEDRRREALRDALLFRAKRYSIFPQAADEERQLENHEGLAEYTGLALAISSDEDRRRFAIQKLRQAERLQSYTRAFAYHTTPAYGILLDAVSSDWTRSISHRNKLPDVVKNRYRIQLPHSPADEAERRAQVYDGDTIIASERERDRERQKAIAEYRNRFITEPRLIIPLEERRISFDPRTVTPLDDHGRVYTTMEVSDVWGNLKVTRGALLKEDWSGIIIDLPDDRRGRTFESNGYVLELREGWEIVPGDRHGEYTVKKR